jgi:hypothetical protein
VVDIGARLARRFTLLASEPVDIPGIERFLANDSRLRRDVQVDVITALAPSSVRQAAGSAARVRDPRLLRVLASGRERIGDESWAYVVTERIEGMPLADLLAARRVPARIAGAIIGDTARALDKALVEGVHHGYLRAQSIAIAPTGRVTLSGLGIDGELAMQAGIGRGASEASDAMALGKVFLAAITGRDADAVTERDLPEDLGTRARLMCLQVIDGTGPLRIDDVLRALAPIDTRVLRDFPALVSAMPLLAPTSTEIKRGGRRAARAATGIAVAPDAVARADHAAQEDWAEGHADAQLSESLATIDAASGRGVVPPDERPQPRVDPLTAPLSQVERVATPPADSIGANELHDLYEFDEMVEVQNVDKPPSTWEALLLRMHEKWPASEGITHRLDKAHQRANRAGPIKAAPILVPLMVIGVIITAIWAFSALQSPLEVPGNDKPQNTYPAFTNSPSPSPSDSASAEAEKDEG